MINLFDWFCLKIRPPPYLKGRIFAKSLDIALILWYCGVNKKYEGADQYEKINAYPYSDCTSVSMQRI